MTQIKETLHILKTGKPWRLLFFSKGELCFKLQYRPKTVKQCVRLASGALPLVIVHQQNTFEIKRTLHEENSYFLEQ